MAQICTQRQITNGFQGISKYVIGKQIIIIKKKKTWSGCTKKRHTQEFHSGHNHINISYNLVSFSSYFCKPEKYSYVVFSQIYLLSGHVRNSCSFSGYCATPVRKDEEIGDIPDIWWINSSRNGRNLTKLSNLKLLHNCCSRNQYGQTPGVSGTGCVFILKDRYGRLVLYKFEPSTQSFELRKG